MQPPARSARLCRVVHPRRRLPMRSPAPAADAGADGGVGGVVANGARCGLHDHRGDGRRGHGVRRWRARQDGLHVRVPCCESRQRCGPLRSSWDLKAADALKNFMPNLDCRGMRTEGHAARLSPPMQTLPVCASTRFERSATVGRRTLKPSGCSAGLRVRLSKAVVRVVTDRLQASHPNHRRPVGIRFGPERKRQAP